MSNQADITKKALLKRLKNNRKSGATPSSEEMQQWLNHSSTAVLKATTLGSFKKHRAGNVFPVNFFSEWACPLRVDSGASVDSFMLYSIGDRCVLFESVAVILVSDCERWECDFSQRWNLSFQKHFSRFSL